MPDVYSWQPQVGKQTGESGGVLFASRSAASLSIATRKIDRVAHNLRPISMLELSIMAIGLHMQGPAGDGVPEAYADQQQASATCEDDPAGWLLYTDHRHGHETQRQ